MQGKKCYLDESKKVFAYVKKDQRDYFLHIQNDNTNKDCQFNVSTYRLSELADFINKYVDTTN